MRVKRNLPLPASYSAGFTLIELVTVIILVGILSSAVAPRLFNSSSYQTKMYFDQIVAGLRYASKYSMSTSCDVQVSLTTVGSGTVINLFQRSGCTTDATGTNSGNFGSTSIYNPSLNLATDQLLIPSQIPVSSSGLPIYFTSQGQAKSSTTNLISNATLQIGTFTLTIIGGTGYVSD